MIEKFFRRLYIFSIFPTVSKTSTENELGIDVSAAFDVSDATDVLDALIASDALDEFDDFDDFDEFDGVLFLLMDVSLAEKVGGKSSSTEIASKKSGRGSVERV
jgi:hypothetical protein